MFADFIFEQDQKDEKTTPKTSDQQQMVLFANHALQVSQADHYRFPTSQFGYRFSSTCSPYLLQDFSQVLRRYTHLEAYCAASDDCAPPVEKVEGAEPDLFQALFFPRSIAPRTSMRPIAAIKMTETTLSSMWFRLVAHYFEWLAGIPELQYMNDQDKIRLAVVKLCSVICLSLVYANYESTGDPDILLFGSEFYWDPATCRDPLMNQYCEGMQRIVTLIVDSLKKVNINKEEFVLAKLIVFFDCTNLLGISDEGLEFTRSMCNKYRTTLSEYVRYRTEKMSIGENWSEQKIDQVSMERMRTLLDMPMFIEKLGKVDDEGLTFMVMNNYGGMKGTLQKQIHTESKKIKILQ